MARRRHRRLCRTDAQRAVAVSAAGGRRTAAPLDSRLAGFGDRQPGRAARRPGRAVHRVQFRLRDHALATAGPAHRTPAAPARWARGVGLVPADRPSALRPPRRRRDGGAVRPRSDLQITGPAVPVLDGVFTVTARRSWPGRRRARWSTCRAPPRQRVCEVVRVDAGRRRHAHRHAPGTAASTHLRCRPTAAGWRWASGWRAARLGIWIKQLDRGPFTRLTFGGQDRRPAWSPDGGEVAFLRDSLNRHHVYVRGGRRQRAGRPARRLERAGQEVAWSPDGRWLVLRTDNGGPGAGDILGVRTSGRLDAGAAGGERLHRAPPRRLARRPLAGVHLHRVRRERGLRAAVPGHDGRDDGRCRTGAGSSRAGRPTAGSCSTSTRRFE